MFECGTVGNFKRGMLNNDYYCYSSYTSRLFEMCIMMVVSTRIAF